MRNGEQKNNTCKVGQKGSRVPLRFKTENIGFVSSQRKSLRVSVHDGQTPKSQTVCWTTRRIWNKLGRLFESKRFIEKCYLRVFTGVNGPHKGVWRFDLNDIWNGSHIQLGSHSWKEILQIKTHTHTLIKDKRMYPKLLDKCEPLKHVNSYLQMWSNLICLEIALFRQALIKSQFHRMSENFGHPASQTE